MLDRALNWVAKALRKLGAEEKTKPGHVSSARVLAYLWGFGALALMGVAGYIALTATAQPVNVNLLGLVAQAIAGCLTALGLRTKGGTKDD